MNESTRKKVSVFALAKRPGGFSVDLRPSDVLELRPGWSEEEAKAFLGRHAREIAQAMIVAAGLVMADRIRSEAGK